MPRINNKQFYESAIKKYGLTAKGVHWNSKASQEIRFETILSMLPNDLSRYTLVDAGCGFGDFYTYLKKKDKLPLKYIGIDTLDKMVNIAHKNTSQQIIKADISKEQLIKADYYICSGAINILDRFETHLFIQNCYHFSKYAFIFNILHGDKESETYNYISTIQLKNIAKHLQVQNMKMTTGYLKSDATVLFVK